MPDPKKVSAPIRMSADLLEKVNEASLLTGLKQSDILRLALEVGLEDLRRINYNIPGTIVSAANAVKEPPLLKVAEGNESSPSIPASTAKPATYPTAARRKKEG